MNTFKKVVFVLIIAAVNVGGFYTLYEVSEALEHNGEYLSLN